MVIKVLYTPQRFISMGSEKEEGPLTSARPTFEVSLSGLAAWSLRVQARLQLSSLYARQGVSNASGLCAARETTHRILSCVLNEGRRRAGEVETVRDVQQRAVKEGGGSGGADKRRKLKKEGGGSSKAGRTKALKALLHAELCQM